MKNTNFVLQIVKTYMSNKNADATLRLLEVMDTLREQCPWDRE